ncbi:MAG: sodium:calcium antiporter [Parcubacteria group bacterium]|nr:sodium:calcium antiporter [Parcubacteria group bacterium]
MDFSFFIFAGSLALITWAGRLLPRAVGGIAEILKLSQFITAFFFVALATSVPELFIGISSAFQGVPTLSLGNIFGSNLADITLVIGAAVIISGAVRGDGRISSQNFWLIFLIGVLPILLGADGTISRGDGFVLIGVFALYLIKIFRDKEYFHKEMTPAHRHPGLRSVGHVFHHLSRFLLGVAVLLASSFLLIWSAREIVQTYFASQYLLFGAIVLALGTVLPELIFSIRAVAAGQAQAMLGNALGSIAFKAAAVVGLVAIIQPIVIETTENFVFVAAALFIAFLFFHLFVYTANRITRFEAVMLLLVYFGFFAASLLL